MGKKGALELKRQVFHLLFGIIIAYLYATKIVTVNILFIIFIAGFIISLASLKYKIPVVYWFLRNFERDYDLKNNPGKGMLMYMAGILLALLIFEEKVALASIMVLAFGDSASHLIGSYFGNYRLKNSKHLEGTMGGIFFASLAAAIFIEPNLAFVGSAAAMLTEMIELRIGKLMIDDNLIIPLIAGLAIYLAQSF